MADHDGTDAGSFVGGYLDREATATRVEERITTAFEEGESVTRSDLEAVLPHRSYGFIGRAVRALERDDVITVDGETYRPGPAFDAGG